MKKSRDKRIGLFLLFLLIAFSGEALAEGWTPELKSHPAGPSRFLAISKKKQRFFIFEQKSPLSLVNDLACTTGEKEGDKLVEGDLRTPEGVYFIQSRKDEGLDFDLYGNLAFTLNFPNPVDRLRGKTGFGIWIHGRGHDIVPRETKGCIALNNNDISGLDPLLGRNMPVVVARDLIWSGQIEQSKAPKELLSRVEAWAQAWKNKDDAFFSFYDPQKYSQAQNDSFSAFKNHKKGLFNSLPWIEVRLYDLRFMPGPGYWVTWFNQFYRSPSLTSQGIKRLYWELDDSGQFRIVGKEWDEGVELDLEKRYIQSVSAQAGSILEKWRKAWEAGDIDAYKMFYVPDVVQGNRKGIDTIVSYKKQVWDQARPKKVIIDGLKFDLHPEGLKVRFKQVYHAGDGYSDNGFKTLLFRPHDDSWLIANEQWSAR